MDRPTHDYYTALYTGAQQARKHFLIVARYGLVSAFSGVYSSRQEANTHTLLLRLTY
jgi:hypothetical protein